ncbi:MAG: flagellar brake domain-containing protein [Chitinophagaceae bacterium]|nr:flagellar brake domain-containing protein [Chitinophagaceae bacterium]
MQLLKAYLRFVSDSENHIYQRKTTIIDRTKTPFPLHHLSTPF